jgi:hypothetical protein
MKKLLNFGFFLGIVLLAACEYETIIPDVPSPDVPVSFSTDLIPIFNKSCNGCHAAGGPKPDLTPANAYNSLVENNEFIPNNADQSILYLKCTPSGSMAPYINASELQLIKNWINQGGKNN